MLCEQPGPAETFPHLRRATASSISSEAPTPTSAALSIRLLTIASMQGEWGTVVKPMERAQATHCFGVGCWSAR